MRYKVLLSIISILIIAQSTVFATQVQLNGKIIDFTDEKGNKVEAQIINDRTMVPLRKIFELLGCQVEWEGETQRITAIKGERKIELQINNCIAQKWDGDEFEQIKLDSAPVIVNDRTLVPLRFVAESLDKQVGWDGTNATAIIIDYEYFGNKINEVAPALYYFLMNDYGTSKNSSGTIVRKYVDKDDANINNTANISFEIVETKNSDSITQNMNLGFEGNNPLMQDIINEKWNNSSLQVVFDEDKITHSANGVIANIVGDNGEKKYSDINLLGGGSSNLEELFKNWIGITEKDINVNIFAEILTDFNKLCDLVGSNNISENGVQATKHVWKFSTKNLNYANAKMKYFDLCKLDNIIFDNMYSRAYNYINKNIFNYDLIQEDMLYDTNKIVISGEVVTETNGEKLLSNNVDIVYKAENQYNETWEYNIKINY